MPESTKGLFDYAAYVSIAAGILAAVGAIGAFVSGAEGSGSFLAFLVLFLGTFPITAYAITHADYMRARRERAEARELIERLLEQNGQAVTKWRQFHSDLDRIIADERAKLQKEVHEKRSEAERMVDFANNREKTIDNLGRRFLNDTTKWVGSKLTGQNFSTQKDRLIKAIEFCRKNEYEVPADTEAELLSDLKREYEAVLRREHAKAEQARIKAKIREEQKAERELEREMRRVAAERQAIEAALAEALAKAAGEHTAEVEALQAKLTEAEARSQRALSMAQQTRAGHIYVISNVGSFGESVFKVGMTRRLEPLDRVKELGDASVPFPFDVHMMISCDDAPKLENALHRALHGSRVNRVNLRKEYFRTNLESIREIVVEHHGEVDYVAEPEALEYRESIQMSDDDFALVEEIQYAAGVADEDDWE
ncbi:GIY-YIG nuclease family protein [Botrimarina sp.]|uniref:GIY-YIG nuclease family protein n=1 Tax=Botrimarina sp. TaxID=2795802 RepID=UPI0032EE1A7F